MSCITKYLVGGTLIQALSMKIYALTFAPTSVSLKLRLVDFKITKKTMLHIALNFLEGVLCLNISIGKCERSKISNNALQSSIELDYICLVYAKDMST